MILAGDCVERMAELEPESIDAIVTDPPYGLEFMGKEWDALGRSGVQRKAESGGGDRRAIVDADEWAGGESSPYSRSRVRWQHGSAGPAAMQEWHHAWATQALRILKPGGHLLAFGGTRTYHRLACAVEDAGFEIRDSLIWLYGSGFPKSHNLNGDRQGWGTALKPAHEPIVVARKPLSGTVAANVLEHGTGAINIDGCRVGFAGDADEQESKQKNRHADFGSEAGATNTYGDYADELQRNYDAPGRWPPNVVLSHSIDCDLGEDRQPPCPVAELDRQSGELHSQDPATRNSKSPRSGVIGFADGGLNYGDTGGASRFFYCAKASRAERNAGLYDRAKRELLWSSGEQNPGSFQAEGTDRSAHNAHPTVKPIALMGWLVRLVTPPGGTVLDPFAGSGTTGIAAGLEGFDFIGIERDPEYAELAEARIAFWSRYPGATVEAVLGSEAPEREADGQGSLFMKALDLFAGPGGWDVAADQLGLSPLGIEHDLAACETRDAAGHPTLQADIAALEPLDFAPIDLLIASPPCQAWSMAGKRGGERDKEMVRALTDQIARPASLDDGCVYCGRPAGGADEHDACVAASVGDWEDERSRLVTEPLRWALALRPRYIALEQVPPVLDYWRHIGEILRREGYGVWCGILEAERYGVPQTRERAILMAELEGHPHPPAPTHQRYVPGEPAQLQPGDLFGGEILPWVSMAEALGWGERVVQHTRSGGGEKPDVPLSEPSRTVCGDYLSWRVEAAPYEGAGLIERHGAKRRRTDDEPAPTLRANGGSNASPGFRWQLRANAQENAAERGAGEPAPTITGGHDTGDRVWVDPSRPNSAVRRGDEPAPTVHFSHQNDRRWLRAGTNENDVARAEDEPAPTVRFGERLNTVEWVEEDEPGKLRTNANTRSGEGEDRHRPDGLTRDLEDPAPTVDSAASRWTADRPATNVNCDPRVHPPGHKINGSDIAAGRTDYEQRAGANAVRVTEQEAAILQGFPPNYPWQGSRTKRFQQIGNAIPPPLARAILEALTS